MLRDNFRDANFSLGGKVRVSSFIAGDWEHCDVLSLFLVYFCEDLFGRKV